MAAFVPVIQKEAWAQCENLNCQKWRKLPAGSVINEDEPWYCYMNPDITRNTCSASEVEYDDNKELVIDGADDPEEEARNRAIMAQFEATIAAATAAQAAAAPARGRGRGRASSSSRGRGGRGRGRPPLSGSRGPSLFDYGGPAPRKMRSVSFLDDEDEDGGEADSDDDAAAGLPGGRTIPRPNKRQIAKHLQRLLENQGQWEAPRGAAAHAVPAALPSEAWESLTHAALDTAADLACAAADLASSVRYFEGPGNAAQEVVTEVATLTRLGTMLAAASGLVDCQDALTKAERERLGLEEIAILPDPNQALEVLSSFMGEDGDGDGGVEEEAAEVEAAPPIGLNSQQQQPMNGITP